MWIAALFVVVEIIGILSAVKAIMETRTSQGAVAWVLSLVTIPWIAVPAYWIFGRKKFQGFVELRAADIAKTDSRARLYLEELKRRQLVFQPDRTEPFAIERLGKIPFSTGNRVELLIDGEATFASIFAGIDRARDYVLVQFYILRPDGLGTRLKEKLIERAQQGIRCYLLYDEIGSLGLGRKYISDLEAAGVGVRPFNSRKGRANRLQINFRNHRKIVVVDGTETWVGGLNVGDEYLGLDPEVGFWRDTHAHLEGPAAHGAQVSFLEDWNWAAEEVLELDWQPRPASDGSSAAAMVLPTGPADEIESCTLLFLGAISRARERLWIATPYFVPDVQFVSVLQLASLRGVDVRIIVPEKVDNAVVGLSHWSYLEELEQAGIKVFRHQKGFMHQKVMLMDDQVAVVGTANFDNRSFRLNFEVSLVVVDQEFNRQVAEMIENDLRDSERVSASELQEKGFLFRLAVRMARLAAPIQ